MPADANKLLAQRYFDLTNDAHLETLGEEVFAPGYRFHLDPATTLDCSATIGLIATFLSAFPGLHHAVEDQLADGDRVATRIVVRGTHQREFMGLAPTGKTVVFEAIYVHRIEDGRIAEQWLVSDRLAMMQQLGIVPAPGR